MTALRLIEASAQSGLSGATSVDESLSQIEKVLTAARAASCGTVPHSHVLNGTAHSNVGVLRNVITTLPYFVFWKDRDSRYLGCNDAFARAAGKQGSEGVVGLMDYDLPWTREESDWFRECDRRVMESGIPELFIEETQLMADGRQRFVQTSKVPLRDERNAVVGILGIYNDVTERRELERELLKAKEAAEASAKAKTEFLATMSHELRTPLTLILSPIEELLQTRRADLPERVDAMLDCVRRNAYRLQVLTDDILDFSKHEAGRLALHNDSLDLATHLSELVLDMQPSAAARGLRLDLDVLDGTGGAVLLDASKLDRVIINLIGNAFKFTPTGGRVTLGLRSVGGSLMLSVTDTGIGIDPRDHDRLFRRFEQIDSSSTRTAGGTGLGLAVVKAFAESMGGSVSVKSAAGEGATFTVRLPCVISATPPKALNDVNELAPSRFSPLNGPGAPFRSAVPRQVPQDAPLVVIAEDNDDLRQYLCDLLAQEFRVCGVPDGQAAYAAIREQNPDVIVSDVMMPHLDGFELVAKLKADAELAAIPVIVLTARAGHEASAEGLDRGADDYLSKPFSSLDLLARVRASCRMRRLHVGLVEAERGLAQARQREALQKTQAKLAELSRLASLGEMAAGIAHEVSQPLSSIGVQATACLRWLGLPNIEQARLAVTRIERDASFANEVIHRVRKMLRKSRVEREPFDLNEALGEVLALTHDKVSQCGAVIRAEFAEGLPLLEGDRIQLQQVVINLIANAAEATRDIVDRKREIVVRTSAEPEHLCVEVRDSGVGIQPGHAERIFEPLHTTKPNGMGIGLAISRRIIESHGGSIGVSRADGVGTSVQFSIPNPPPRVASVPD